MVIQIKRVSTVKATIVIQEQVAQCARIAHLKASTMFGDTINYDALKQITLNLKQ